MMKPDIYLSELTRAFNELKRSVANARKKREVIRRRFTIARLFFFAKFVEYAYRYTTLYPSSSSRFGAWISAARDAFGIDAGIKNSIDDLARQLVRASVAAAMTKTAHLDAAYAAHKNMYAWLRRFVIGLLMSKDFLTGTPHLVAAHKFADAHTKYCALVQHSFSGEKLSYAKTILARNQSHRYYRIPHVPRRGLGVS